MKSFATFALVPSHALASISALLVTFTDFTTAPLVARGANALPLVKAGPPIQTGGAAVCFVTAGAVVPWWTYAHTRAHAQASVQASRGAQGFFTVRPIETILAFTDVPFIAEASIATSTGTLSSLAGFEEDGIVWGPQDDVAPTIHDQYGDLESSYAILIAKAGKAHLNH